MSMHTYDADRHTGATTLAVMRGTTRSCLPISGSGCISCALAALSVSFAEAMTRHTGEVDVQLTWASLRHWARDTT